MGQLEVLHQLAVGSGLFQRRQVGADHVLDEGEFEHVPRGNILDHDRHRVKAGEPSGTPATLAGDQGVASLVGAGRDDERLDHAVHADRRGQRVQFVGIHGGPRLEGVGFDSVNRHLGGDRAGGGGQGWNQRPESAAQTAATPGQGADAGRGRG